MSVFSQFDIAGSGVQTQRLWMDLISNNIANANATRGTGEEPYQRRVPVMRTRGSGTAFGRRLLAAAGRGIPGPAGDPGSEGVEVAAIATDNAPPQLRHDPDHPEADDEGYVQLPNVDVGQEMVDMLAANRAYQANLSVIQTAKEQANAALQLGRA